MATTSLFCWGPLYHDKVDFFMGRIQTSRLKKILIKMCAQFGCGLEVKRASLVIRLSPT